jgi:hypothetical protein
MSIGNCSAIEGSSQNLFKVLSFKILSYGHRVHPFKWIGRKPKQAARDSMRRLAERAIQRKRPAFLFMNNRLEGHAPTTVEAVADAIVT